MGSKEDNLSVTSGELRLAAMDLLARREHGFQELLVKLRQRFRRRTCSDEQVLDGLTAREAKVLRMRFGIDMNTDHTLEEVGKQFDVTRERIRQIEAKALRKLRHPSRSDNLRSFIDAENSEQSSSGSS